MSAIFQSTLGNVMVPDAAIGFEPISRATRLLLSTNLNTELDAQERKWAAADLKLQQQGFDVGVGQIDLEAFTKARFHEGPHESLLEAPASSFPNISIMAYQHQATAVPLFDQMISYDITLFVETMVKAGPVTDATRLQFETIVHRRIHRTTEAVNNVIQRDPTLMGTVLPMQSPPQGNIGRMSWVKNDGKNGKPYLWQGSRLQYSLQRVSTTG